mmetsp:Transcript_853/g.2619  ORF Transcript_853/g.2619 Transcript_853/m.2619 type:complete len:241 (-) Transcript_853:148-870(-)
MNCVGESEEAIAKFCPQIEHLAIRSSVAGLKILLNNCMQLKSLHLFQGSDPVYVLKESSIRPTLKSVRFEGLRALSLDQRSAIPCNLHELFPSLITLCLSNCTDIDTKAISKLIPLFGKIEQLVLHSIHLQEEVFFEMIMKCSELRSLALIDCKTIPVITILQTLLSYGDRINDVFFHGDKVSMDRSLRRADFSALARKFEVHDGLGCDDGSFQLVGEEVLSRWMMDNFFKLSQPGDSLE